LDKPNTIEELAELREWSKSIPEKVSQQQVGLQQQQQPVGRTRLMIKLHRFDLLGILWMVQPVECVH